MEKGTNSQPQQQQSNIFYVLLYGHYVNGDHDAEFEVLSIDELLSEQLRDALCCINAMSLHVAMHDNS